METEDERCERYLKQNKGFWFASCPEFERWAEKKVKEGILKPLSSIVPNKNVAKDWYILSEYFTTEDLLIYFSEWALNQFGIYSHNLDYQI